ncbi:MAG TPA: cytochrome c-type biogenesis protein [Thermoanaerobaculia bacterium]|jgi:cytochrome c-type biogenesis protein CcmH|nr:cytochrome c-type biogenesis protein [Thermoanaerobaculia bacterium]
MIFLLLLIIAAPEASMFVGPPQGKPLAGPALDAKTHEVASLLRCPVCQGMSVADSPAEMALNMKRQVNALLARGYTQDQILEYFERSYGEFVLLKPKFRGVNTFVWILPIFALAIGAVIAITKARKLEKSEDPYLARVRDLVERKD